MRLIAARLQSIELGDSHEAPSIPRLSPKFRTGPDVPSAWAGRARAFIAEFLPDILRAEPTSEASSSAALVKPAVAVLAGATAMRIHTPSLNLLGRGGK
jgi:hypothetical protein